MILISLLGLFAGHSTSSWQPEYVIPDPDPGSCCQPKKILNQVQDDMRQVQDDMRQVQDDMRQVQDDMRQVQDDMRQVQDDMRQVQDDIGGCRPGG